MKKSNRAWCEIKKDSAMRSIAAAAIILAILAVWYAIAATISNHAEQALQSQSNEAPRMHGPAHPPPNY